MGAQLLDALDVALDAARWTDGIVDPTIGTALRALGYDRDFATLPAVGPPVVTLERVPGWQAVVVDRAAGTVTVPAGVRLDLGATAKALAADLAAAEAASRAGCGVLVSLGGDLAIAGGPPEGGWAVLVADDHLEGRVADRESELVELDGGGLATSSTTVRQWQRGEQDLHHIVDPATGAPAEVVWRTVSVAARSCVDANVAATASIVLGAAAPAWLERQGLPARLVAPDGRTVHVAGWPEEDRPMTAAIVGTGGQALWFFTRGSGAVALVLLTASFVLGILTMTGWRSRTLSRMVVEGIHRSISLLVLVFVALHVATAVLDGFVTIRWIDAVVPFQASYRAVWLGLGRRRVRPAAGPHRDQPAAVPVELPDLEGRPLARLRHLAHRHGPLPRRRQRRPRRLVPPPGPRVRRSGRRHHRLEGPHPPPRAGLGPGRARSAPSWWCPSASSGGPTPGRSSPRRRARQPRRRVDGSGAHRGPRLDRPPRRPSPPASARPSRAP